VEDREGQDLELAVLSRPRASGALAIALAALLLSGCGDGHAVGTTASTASKDAVGAVEVGTDGQVTISGAVPTTPAPRPQATKTTIKTKPRIGAETQPRSAASEIGQMIVSPVAGLTADPALLARIRAGQVGSVILFANNINSVDQVRALIADLQSAAKAGGRPPLLVMTDQEGGLVKRFGAAPPTLSAAAIGASSHPGATARQQGAATGRALRDRGVNLDLAPVADVPVGPSFLSTRAFSRRPRTVATAACRFAAGLRAVGVGAALKHFPGLGRAGAVTTDAAPVTIQQVGADDLAAYRRCAAAPGTLVMMANAVYTGLTGGQPAVVSRGAYRLLREDVGFVGATISDSLDAGAVRRQPDLAVRAARAGIDLELWTKTARAQLAYRQLSAAVRSGRLSERRVAEAVRRVRALKTMLTTA
jgi:beta-N-acetylhexosaminidase